jgi:hypothetical protein
MTTLFEGQIAAVLGAYARGLLVADTAFSNGGLTIVERDPGYVWQYTALAVTTPGGTVVSVAPGMREYAESVRPGQHYAGTSPAFLQRLALEAAKNRGATNLGAPGLGFALKNMPAAPSLPDGLAFELKDQAWMAAEQHNLRFENGVGRPQAEMRAERNRYGVAIVDTAGQPVAVAGVFDTFGLSEIGVDVLRARRGERLGAAVVAAATRAVLDRGETPFYACDAANVRSARTGLSVGYVPVFQEANVA